MDAIDYGGIVICGNFSELLDEKPKDFDYMSSGKWLEDYWLDQRECIGGTVCSCRKIQVHYQPWYGFDLFHSKGCNLLRKVELQPQLMTLWAYEHLPSIMFSGKAVPAATRPSLYVLASSRTYKVRVRVAAVNRTASLFKRVVA